MIDTPIRAAMPADKKKAMLDHAAATLPARRVGQADDVADAILMLMTNPFTTGSTLFVVWNTSTSGTDRPGEFAPRRDLAEQFADERESDTSARPWHR